MASGAVRILDEKTSPEVLRALTTAQLGDQTAEPDLEPFRGRH